MGRKIERVFCWCIDKTENNLNAPQLQAEFQLIKVHFMAIRGYGDDHRNIMFIKIAQRPEFQ